MKPNTPATDAVRRLHRFLIEDPEEMSNERVIAALAADGIDVNKAVSEIKKKIQQAQNRLRLEEIRSGLNEKASQVSGALGKVRDAATDVVAEIKSAIERIRLIQPETAAVFYRKLEETNPEDLESLLTDLQYLSEEENRSEDPGRP